MGKVPSLRLDLGILLPHRFLYRLELANSLMVFGRHLADMVIPLVQLLLEGPLVVLQ